MGVYMFGEFLDTKFFIFPIGTSAGFRTPDNGGVFIALLFYGYLYNIVTSRKVRPIEKWLIILSVTVFVGVVWEFAEWIGTYYNFDYLGIGDLEDTLLDLVADLFGAFTLFIVHPVRQRNS